MRKPDAALNAVRNAPQIARRPEAPEALVCLALIFATFVLVFRIATIF
jgi:hypothetical protein